MAEEQIQEKKLQGIASTSNSDQLYCSKCHKTMRATNFYQYKDGSKCELCKNCLTMHINNTDPNTFMWLLEKFDVPWIEEEWNQLYMKAYNKDPYKLNGMSVFGKYLAAMRLRQHKDQTFADTQKLIDEKRQKAEEQGNPAEQYLERMAEMKEAYERGDITEAQWMTYQSMAEAPQPYEESAKPVKKEGTNLLVYSTLDLPIPEFNPDDSAGDPSAATPYPINDHPFEEVELPDMSSQLTQEDKIYLATKWGRLYSAENWVYLEKKYNDFMASFDIQGAAREDTLIQICKLSLKMNDALDSGDMDSYAKLVRAYDSLMKSAKFDRGLCNTFPITIGVCA